MIRTFYYNVIALAAVLLGTAFFVNAKVLYTPNLSEIVTKYNKATVTISLGTEQLGTGFAIEGDGEMERYIYTAAHVVKGAYWVDISLHDEKNSEWNWKIGQKCSGHVRGLDVKRDVAILVMSCDNCNCSHLGKLPIRTKAPKIGENVIIIGKPDRTGLEKSIHGTVKNTDVKISLMNMSYVMQDKDKKFDTTAVHIKAGYAKKGDSGSAILGEDGSFYAMVSAGKNGTVLEFNNIIIPILEADIFGVPLKNIQEASQQIIHASTLYTAGCSTDVSAFLGAIYWGNTSGNSINEMNALATAANAPYFAVAHDDHGIAHGYTFMVLRWNLLNNDDDMEEHFEECLCETNPFKEDDLVTPQVEGKFMCGCAENTCMKNIGKKECRWAIYKRLDGRYYVPTKESNSVQRELAVEVEMWKKKVKSLEKEK